ncbi:MAG: hypothetical protein JRI66_11865 [Deltaproteobacteria bacterium]|nr:hypothetical protein [Deltaproteobacteria bacterium]
MLRDLILHILEIFKKINWPPHPVEYPTLFLLSLWDPDHPYYNDEYYRNERNSILGKGLKEEDILKPFKKILEEDKHLFKCCGNILTLGVLIDKFFYALCKKRQFSRSI